MSKSRTHNKKRNTGLLYEFLVKDISRALVEDNSRRSSLSLKILKNHFKPGTLLYKEFRLINSLIKTTVSSEAVAASIIHEAKLAARAHDVKKLDREKSILIRNINHRINDNIFYDQHISEYKMYATIQTLLNDWRSEGADLQQVALYEDQLVKWLTVPKELIKESAFDEESTGQGRLLMKLMMQKLNEKYASVLNETQRDIVKAYVWSTTKDDINVIKQKLNEVKTSLLSSIDQFKIENSENAFVNNKLVEVNDQLNNETFEKIDDETITRFMLYVKLNEELLGKDDGIST